METKKCAQGASCFPREHGCCLLDIQSYNTYINIRTGPLIVSAPGPSLTQYNLAFLKHQCFLYPSVS